MQSNTPKTQRILNNVCASMKMEGFSVSAKTQQSCRAIAAGEKSAAELIKQRLAAYKQK